MLEERVAVLEAQNAKLRDQVKTMSGGGNTTFAALVSAHHTHCD